MWHAFSQSAAACRSSVKVVNYAPAADRAIPRHRDIDLRSSDIYTGSIQIQARQHRHSDLLLALSFSRHGSLGIGFVPASRPRLCTREYSPERDQHTLRRAAVITELSTESGTILLSGLPKDAPLLFSAYLPAHMDRSFYRAMHEPQFLTFLSRAARVGYS